MHTYKCDVSIVYLFTGQTGTGKTFTMYGHGWEGKDKEKDKERDKDGERVGVGLQSEAARDDSINSDAASSSSSSSTSSWGIVPRAVAELFQFLEETKAAAAAAGKPFDFAVSKCFAHTVHTYIIYIHACMHSYIVPVP